MAVPIPGVQNAEASLLSLELKRETAEGALQFVSQVRLVNTATGQSTVTRFIDLPDECVEPLRHAIATIEAHAGSRFFAGIV